MKEAFSPVHYVAKCNDCKNCDCDKSGWYFWIETWADREGPFKTRAEAEAALKEYARHL